MLYIYIYIVNIFNIRVPRFLVRFSYFGYRNIRTIRVFEGFGPGPVPGISVQAYSWQEKKQKNREVFTIPDIQLQLQCNASSSLSACSLS